MKNNTRSYFLIFIVVLWISLVSCQLNTPGRVDETTPLEVEATPTLSQEIDQQADQEPTATEVDLDELDVIETVEIQTATDTPIPPTEEAPTPIDEFVQTFDFKELAFFGILPFEYEPCQDAVYGITGNETSITLDDTFGAQLSGLSFLCLFNFPEAESVEVTITNPLGQQVSVLDATINRNIDGIPTGLVPLVFAFDLPTGVWEARAQLGDLTAETSFSFDPENDPKITVVRENARDIQDPADLARTTVIYPGEDIIVLGRNLPEIEGLQVAVMKFNDEVWNAIDGKIAQIQDDGRFELAFTIPEDTQSGSYMVVAFIEPFTGLEFQPSVYTLFSVFKE